MIKVSVRFYEELNDYLPENMRKKDVELDLSDGSKVKDILNKFSIPSQEVHLVLINGKNSLLETKLNSGDRVSIYPIFETIDISPIKIINAVIDTHVHLEEIENLDQVLLDAKQSGVIGLVAVGSDYTSNRKIIELSKEIKTLKIYLALGIHPTDINLDELEITMKFIEQNISGIVAIGEIGLDYWYGSVKKSQSERETQHKIFELQLVLAKKYSKPVIIHSRGAWQECYEMVKNKNIEKAVFHWYSGPIDVLSRIIHSGYFISVTPVLEYSKEHKLAAEQTPLENILIETDSPVKYKTVTGETYIAEPKDVIRTLKHLSAIKKIPFDELVQVTKENAVNLFNI